MSERTEQNKKSELVMVFGIVVVVVMLALPIALSVFRHSNSFFYLFMQSAPFVLIATAVIGMIYVSKTDK